MTSPLLPSQKTEEGKQRSFGIHENNCSEIGLFNRKYQPINDIYTLKCPKTNQGVQEAKARHPGSTTYDGIKCDDIVASSNSDVITRVPDINRLIARKRYVPRKRSLTYSVGSSKRSLRACIRIITFIMLFVAITTSILGGLINTRRCERKAPLATQLVSHCSST